MRLIDGPANAAYAQSVGSYFLDLHRDTSWIVRRVETVRILDEDRVDRHVTIDVDVEMLIHRLMERHEPRPKYLAVPLTVLTKNLLLDFSASTAEGPLHLVSSAQDAGVAHAMLLARLEELGKLEGFSSFLSQKLYWIARDFPGSSRIRADDDLDYASEVLALSPGEVSSKEDLETWVAIFQDPEFLKLSIEFANSFMPIVYLNADGPRVQVVKFRYIDASVRPDETSGFGLGASGFYIDAPSVGRGQREHLRIVAPPGVEISDAALISTDWRGEASARFRFRSNERYYARVSTERAVVYTNGAPGGAYEVLFSVWPTSVGFARPAMFTSLVGALLLCLGALAEWKIDLLSKKLEGNQDAAVAFLLVLPSLYSLYLSRSGEHELRSRMLRGMRYAVFGAAVAHGSAVVALISAKALDPKALIAIWGIAGCYCVMPFAYIARFELNRARSISLVRKHVRFSPGPLPIINDPEVAARQM